MLYDTMKNNKTQCNTIQFSSVGLCYGNDNLRAALFYTSSWLNTRLVCFIPTSSSTEQQSAYDSVF